jgi:hypothetical protein
LAPEIRPFTNVPLSRVTYNDPLLYVQLSSPPQYRPLKVVPVCVSAITPLVKLAQLTCRSPSVPVMLFTVKTQLPPTFVVCGVVLSVQDSATNPIAAAKRAVRERM